MIMAESKKEHDAVVVTVKDWNLIEDLKHV